MPKFNKDLPYNSLPDLPPKSQLETVEILKLTIEANKLLGELKGYCQTLPNPEMLLNTIVLQESKDSSAIENIVTTQDDLYKATLGFIDGINNSAAKEVIQYRQALYWGLEQMQKKGVITTNVLIGIMQTLRNSDENIRRNPGTKLANPNNNSIVYTPPEGESVIRQKMAALEHFINEQEAANLDPLIKMALIHYQFEAIHPFSDGNGRTGRILNVLYLINQNLISLPVLYLSYYIIQNKSDYYRLLREVTEKGNWAGWVIFILKGVAETAAMTLQKVSAIRELKQQVEIKVRETLKTSFSRELVDLLFSYPYIKIKVLEEQGIAKRQTSSLYLKKLTDAGILAAVPMWKENYYVNQQLINILSK